MHSMRDYHDLYLETDVHLFVDVSEAFRDVARKNYGLDSLYYLTVQGLSQDAMLKMTKDKLKLFTEPNQVMFVE